MVPGNENCGGVLELMMCLLCFTRFKAAWCSAWELEPVPEIFGEVDVVADTLVDMAEKIIQVAGK